TKTSCFSGVPNPSRRLWCRNCNPRRHSRLQSAQSDSAAPARTLPKCFSLVAPESPQHSKSKLDVLLVGLLLTLVRGFSCKRGGVSLQSQHQKTAQEQNMQRC
ncbi:hypothetical protein BCV70DRAFT_202747, partial [Testicularia cyperi]